MEEQHRKGRDGACESYRCVFCERGFATAQALGGHMNVHKKHRPKDTSTVTTTTTNIVLPTSCLKPKALDEKPKALDEWGMGLRLGSASASNGGIGMVDEDELDLELRLGHGP